MGKKKTKTRRQRYKDLHLWQLELERKEDEKLKKSEAKGLRKRKRMEIEGVEANPTTSKRRKLLGSSSQMHIERKAEEPFAPTSSLTELESIRLAGSAFPSEIISSVPAAEAKKRRIEKAKNSRAKRRTRCVPVAEIIARSNSEQTSMEVETITTTGENKDISK